jgi:hypothetical protein
MRKVIMRRALITMLAGATVLLAAPSAFAAYVDFTEVADLSVNGEDSWSYDTVDGVTVTVTAMPDEPVNATSLYWDSDDGFGVNGWSYEDDEIEGFESLEIRFTDTASSEAVEVQVDELYLTDLFNEHGYLETGTATLDNGSIDIEADPNEILGSGSNGELTLAVAEATTSITLKAPGWHDGKNEEYSIAGLSFSTTAVPELDPSAAGGGLAFLASFLLVATGRRRRREAKK